MLPISHGGVGAASLSARERVLTLLAALNFLVAVCAIAYARRGDRLTTFDAHLHWKSAKYIDLTHKIKPDMPLWSAFSKPTVAAARAGNAVDGFISPGEEFTYGTHGFVATSWTLPTDQMGTQIDPPAHWNEYGATISDLPPTITLRPLVVVDVTGPTNALVSHRASVDDILRHEQQYGSIPEGSVVLFKTNWYMGWNNPLHMASATFPGVSLDALKFLHLQRGILMHGHEPLDTDMTPSLEGEAWLMHHNFMQIEGAANLDKVPPVGCMLSLGFPKVAGGTGGYARLIAICPPDTPGGVTIDEAPGAPLPTQPYPLRRNAHGVMEPTAGALPTEYCKAGSASLGCPMPQ